MLAVSFLLTDRDICGSIFFVLALNYKQMELYHALPFFFYLLGKCLFSRPRTWIGAIGNLAAIGLTVIGTFALVWSPFLGRTWKNVDFQMTFYLIS